MIIGGLLPALIYGITSIFSKASTQAGIGLAIYTIIIGLGVTITGIVLFLLIPDRTFTMKAGWFAFGVGTTWGVGTALVAYALQKYQVPIGTLAPLFNMNTLVTVLLALVIFAEWKEVQPLKLIVGSVLVVLGGILVARA